MLIFRQCSFWLVGLVVSYPGTLVIAALHLLIYFNTVSWNALSSEAYTCTVQIMICFPFLEYLISD